MKSNKSFLFLIGLLLFQFSFAQDQALNIANDLYAKQNYSLAQHYYQNAINDGDLSSSQSDEAHFRLAFCSVELLNDDSEFLLQKYLIDYPAGKYSNLVSYELGRYNFIKKQFTNCILNLQNVDVSSLEESQRHSYYFRLGYSLFIEENYEEAKLAFYELRGVNFSFSDLVNYCVAHMNYIEGNYVSSLNSFYKLSDVPSLGRISKFYIAHIYYFQSRYQGLIDYATALLDTTNTDRNTELFRLLADAHYNLGDYKQSIYSLEKYSELGDLSLSRLENYQLAYSYTQLKQYEDAIPFFEDVLIEDDSLSQFASYHLATTYLELGKKSFALNAFKYASTLSFDLDMQEDAFFNYAKLVYEVDNTYDNAVESFQLYLEKYPDSDNALTIRNLLINAYSSSKEYDSALEFLNDLPKLSLDQKSIFQKISYFKAINLFNAGELNSAIDYFDLSLKNPMSDMYVSLCLYWKGEALYNLSDYYGANEFFKKFIYSSEAIQLEEFNNAYYSIGYSDFKSKNYSEAIKWFREYLGVSTDSLRSADANLRVGDAYFMKSNYSRAAAFYHAAEKINILDVDYALYQQVICYGLDGLKAKKQTVLLDLIANHTTSPYMDDALLDLSNLYVEEGKIEEAIDLSINLTKNYPFSPLVKSALLKLGLHYYNTDQQDLAIQNFKTVIEDFPASSESKEALVALKNVSVDKGNVQVYFDYIDNLSGVSVSVSSQDSISFEAAESIFFKEDYAAAAVAFSNYIQQFENALFFLSASYYLAESAFLTGDKDQAVNSYLKILDMPENEYTKSSLLKVANIEFEKGQYAIAALHYTTLLGASVDDELRHKITISLYQCYKELKVDSQLVVLANEILNLEKVSEALMIDAKLTIANHAFENSEFYLAKKHYLWISANTYSSYGAESKYQLAYLLFLEEDYAASEEYIYQLSDLYSDDYYIAKGFILLADVYVAKKNYFQAKATLTSVLDNFDGDDLLAVANTKMEQIINLELSSTKDVKEEVIIIDLLNSTEFELDSLYDYDEEIYIENEE